MKSVEWMDCDKNTLEPLFPGPRKHIEILYVLCLKKSEIPSEGENVSLFFL